MLSEEEIKQKLKQSKFYLETMIDNKAEPETLEHCRNVTLKSCVEAIEEGLQLITKQQKEIKTLSTQNAMMSKRHLRDSEKLRNSISKDKIREYKQKFEKDSKTEKVFMTQSSQINASLISFCDELLERK